MKPFVVLMLFVGMAMIMHGIYEEKYKRLEKSGRIEYRFVPRSLYDEQLENTEVTAMFKNMFQKNVAPI